MKVRIRENHWYPRLLKVGAITLYPYVLFSRDVTFRMLMHEWVHVRQVRRLGWLRFYASYVWEFLRRYVGGGFKYDKAYRAVSFEAEAYGADTWRVCGSLTADEQAELKGAAPGVLP